MSAERNTPCPCGSGLKYKKCCLTKERPGPDSEAFLWRRLNATDEKLADDLLRFARRELGEDAMAQAREDFLEGSDPDDDVSDADAPTFVGWMLYAWRPVDGTPVPGAETIAAAYLSRRSSKMDPFEREYLEACLAEPFSIYEVIDTAPGAAVVVEDLLRGGRVRVNERSASGMMEARELIWAHVVTVRGLATFSGVGTVPLLPIHKLEVIDLAAEIQGRRKRITTADLHEDADLLRELYVRIRWQRLNPKRPILQNTDGDALAFQKLEFRVEDPERAFDRLADLEVMRSPGAREGDVERDATGKLLRATVTWQKRGNRRMRTWENTILGRLAIEGTSLTVEVNSNERAKKIRKEIERRLGDGVTFVRAIVTSVEKALAEARAHGPSDTSEREDETRRPSPEERAALRAVLASHYAGWADDTREPFDAAAVYRELSEQAREAKQEPETGAVFAALGTIDDWCVEESAREPLDPRLAGLFRAGSLGERALTEETGPDGFVHQFSPRLPFDVLLDGDRRATAADLFLIRHATSLPKEAVGAVRALIAAKDTVARVVRKGSERLVENVDSGKALPVARAVKLPPGCFFCRLVAFRGFHVPLSIMVPRGRTSPEEMLAELRWVVATSAGPMRAAGIRLASAAKAYGLGALVLRRAIDSIEEELGPVPGESRRTRPSAKPKRRS